ncbi:PREDICTED: uncharacterized protein LOC104822123 isoform X2 [Tarenaya hassleriana]|uniref:uncharacterized protein LOC104822123 isoform X2 n=1 Tax=Tarenaya hassleriana TaxID=28532 RepID=UPI00053CA93B|nr:PREDICTED: uncharacterized protein LOC104822123 isoform X2 [Tarenaya hassleriana]
MGAARKFLTRTTESYFDFSDKGGRLRQFLYGNIFPVLDGFWVSVTKLLFFLVGSVISSVFRVRSDRGNSLVVSEEESPSFSSDYRGHDLDGSEGDFPEKEDHAVKKDETLDFPESSLVSVSRRYEFLSDNSVISGFIEEPKAVSFVVHGVFLGSDESKGHAVHEKPEDFSDLQEKPKTVREDSIESRILEKMWEKSDDSSESCFALENKLESSDDFLTEHVKKGMVVCELISCGADVKAEVVHENCVGDGEEVRETTTEESLSEDDDFIELRPGSEILDIVDEEDLIQREEFSMSFEENEDCYNFDDDSDDDDEHNDAIERLKTELRSARTGGLATILEESEAPFEEPKPLKIDAKFELKDRMAEIQKVYRSYVAKMRKLDVLDSQTMHSISLIKLKDSTQPSSRIKDSSFPAAKSPLRQNLWPFKKQQLERDPVERLVKDVSRDFETVYVGHLCLSWEILHWQYLKVVEFEQHDPKGTRQYNLVAGEFQLFQVLMQRFLENEPFRSCPRTENYLKSRRCFHNFLQVPLVRDDRSSSKTSRCRNEGAFAITIEMLREIIRESIRVFWEFICADKHEISSSILKVSHHTQVSPQDPLDLELLTDIRTNLQKKEKRLKEMVRSQGCIVKKMKNLPLKDELLLITQVELKLVSRVTNMSKLKTDQLVWCEEKLNKISFSGRRIQLEPSFSLFPC